MAVCTFFGHKDTPKEIEPILRSTLMDYEDYSDTIFPEELENISPKYAIEKRNRWMVNECDYVVTYVRYTIGGAAKFKELAERKDGHQSRELRSNRAIKTPRYGF